MSHSVAIPEERAGQQSSYPGKPAPGMTVWGDQPFLQPQLTMGTGCPVDVRDKAAASSFGLGRGRAEEEICDGSQGSRLGFSTLGGMEAAH